MQLFVKYASGKRTQVFPLRRKGCLIPDQMISDSTSRPGLDQSNMQTIGFH
jgi:hypothetical protein